MSGFTPLTPNTSPALRIGFASDALVQHDDMLSEQLAAVAEVGKGIMAAQGVLNALPLSSSPVPPLAIATPGGMTINIGGGQMAFIQGYVCDNCELQSFTVPANSSGSTRIDLVAVQAAIVPNGTSISRPTFNNGPTVNEPLNTKGLNYQYVAGTPGGGVPATPNGFVAFATITVASGANAITAGNINVELPTLNPQGVPGANGHGATTTTSTFTIPALNSSVTIPVVDQAAFAANVNVQITDGTHAFAGVVTAIAVGSVTVKNIVMLAGAVGNTMASGAIVTFGGAPGAQGPAGSTGPTGSTGPSGHGSTTSTGAVTIPAVSSSIAVGATDATAFPVGTYGVISDGSHAFIFLVTAVSGSTLTLQNLGVVVGAVGNTIASGATITFSGQPGSVSATVGIGGVLSAYNTGSITLPAYGTWEVRYDIIIAPGSGQFFGTNLAVAGGSMSGVLITNAGNSQNNIPGGFTACLTGVAAGGQTISIATGASGSFGSSPTQRITAIRLS